MVAEMTHELCPHQQKAFSRRVQVESQEDGNKPHPEPRERSVPRVLHARLCLGMAHAGVWSLRGSLSRPSVHSQPVPPVPSALKLGAGRGVMQQEASSV